MTIDTRADGWEAGRRAALLAATQLFGDLPADVLAAVAARCRPHRLRRGGIVFLQGDPAAAVHVLAAGRIKMVQETEDGRVVILRLIRPGEPFGVAGGWGEARYPATAVALDEILLLRLPASDLQTLIAGYPAVALAVVRELAARLREAEARIRELQTERVEQRIARTLLRLAPAGAAHPDAGPAVPLSRQDLADLCGTTLSTTSRLLAAWHRRGLVVAGRERVVLLRLPELAAIAGGRAPLGGERPAG